MDQDMRDLGRILKLSLILLAAGLVLLVCGAATPAGAPPCSFI